MGNHRFLGTSGSDLLYLCEENSPDFGCALNIRLEEVPEDDK